MRLARRRASFERSIGGKLLPAIIASAVAWLLAVGPILGFAHYAFVKHGVCEHGELIHLDSGAETTHQEQSTDALKIKAIRDSSRGHSTDAHDHCGAPGFSQRQHAFVPARAEIRITSLAACDSVARTADVACRAESILSIAPKTSPPASATANV